MNTFTFTLRAKFASKSSTMTFRASSLAEACAMFDAVRPVGSKLLQVSEA